MASKVLQLLVVTLLVYNFLVISLIFYNINDLEVAPSYRSTAAASGIVSMCINQAPEVVIPCVNSTDIGDPYSCLLEGNDTAGSNFTFNSSFLTNITLFNVTVDGLISFTPNESDEGNHTVLFTIKDDSVCSNNEGSKNFTLEISDLNDAPFLSSNIPDVDFLEDESVSAFFLVNHFTDPDGDIMTFNVSGADEAIVVINPSSEVVVSSETCDFSDVVFFTAKDPFNLSATSNAVTITCTVPASAASSSSASGGSGGGGGGAGIPCRADFECFDYLPCSENNTKVQKCVDKNSCDEEELITIECNFEQEQLAVCSEDWLCGDFGACLLNNTRQRDCIDLNKCDTIFNKPETSETCTYTPTCNDGVKNGDETGVDCGGSCTVCTIIESPTPIETEPNFWTNLIIAVLLIALILALAYQEYHKQFYQGLSKLGLRFAGRVPKQILLSDKDRDELFKGIKEVEDHYQTKELTELTKEFLALAHSYFFRISGLEIDATKEDLLAMCEERKLNEHLTRVLASFFDKKQAIDFSPGYLQGYELMYLLEELREVILQTCNYTNEVLHFHATEYAINPDLPSGEKIHLRLVNAYIALHFNQLDFAVNKYMELIEYYEKMPQNVEDEVYNDIARLYQKIRYRAAWIENM